MSFLSHSNTSLALSHHSIDKDVNIEDEKTTIEKQTCCSQFKSDGSYRKKILHTVCLYASFLTMSLAKGQTGPAFLDLQDISGIGMEQGSVLLAVLYIGYMTGAVVGGSILYNMFNRCLQFTINNLLKCSILLVIPWCSLYGLMIAAFFGFGVTVGFIDTVANAEIINIWGRDGKSPTQALHFIFSVGVSISPLYTAPFLRQRNEESKDMQRHFNTNETYKNVTNMSLLPNLTNNPFGPSDVIFKQSQLYLAYMITAVLTFFVALAFFSFYFFYDSSKQLKLKPQGVTTKLQGRQLPVTLTACSLLNMAGILAILCGIDDTFVSYLTAFCVKHLHWTTAEGSFLTSISCLFVAIGRCFGIFIVKCITPMKLVGVHSFGVFLAFVGLFFSSVYFSDVGVWISAIVYGYAKSVTFACVFSWTDEYLMSVTGKVSSLFMVIITLSMGTNSLILGILMDSFSNLWFCYLFLGESIVGMVLCISAVCLTRYVETKYGRTYNDVIVDVNNANQHEIFIDSQLSNDSKSNTT